MKQITSTNYVMDPKANLENKEPSTPGQAAYNRWRSMNQHPLVAWQGLPSNARWMWERCAAAARAFKTK